jgi:hypothetical protein
MNCWTELLRAGLAPSFNGFYRADGTARVAEVDGPALSRLDLGGPFELPTMEDDDGLHAVEGAATG